jgi:nucleotide-binding universal stress UspA family protein
MKTIIACTDFSPNASNAVQYAAALADATNAKLLLFHHFEYPVPATDIPMAYPAAFVDEMAVGLSHRLEQTKTDLAKTYPIEIECVVRSWDLSLDLEEVFQSENADLVVMGMQGQGAVLNTLLGSISAVTMRRGNLPLLVVPRGVAFHPIRKILFPCDDHKMENTGTMKPLLNLALDFDAYIEVLTLFDLQKTPELVPKSGMSDAKNDLEALLTETRHGYSYENEDAVEKGILYEAARSQADMVAMIPHHHSFWSNLLNQSKTQRVAASIMLPLLVLGEKVK